MVNCPLPRLTTRLYDIYIYIHTSQSTSAAGWIGGVAMTMFSILQHDYEMSYYVMYIHILCVDSYEYNVYDI